MADWITVVPFVDDEIVRAAKFQDILTNLNTLKNPAYIDQFLPGPSLANWTSTTTSFNDIDATYYQLVFESFGKDILCVADLITESNAGSVVYGFDFELDGVRLGNTTGLAGHRSLMGRQVVNLLGIAKNVPSGEHVLAVQWRATGVVTMEVEKEACMGIWALELF